MNRLIRIILFVGLAASLPALGQTPPPKKPALQLEQALSEAYKAKTLATLDSNYRVTAPFAVVIEHSLGEGKDQFETRRFKTFAAVDEWLKSRDRGEGAPFRQTMPLTRCAENRCSYNFDGGILHNQLYLHDFSYVLRSRRAHVTRIHLLDGD